MAVPIIMPRQGQSVESCIIAKWLKKKGDVVNVGDILFSYETDKAAFDEEAKVAGTILEIYAEEGDDVPVLTNVCVIGNPGEDVTQFGPIKESNPIIETVKEAESPTVEEKAAINTITASNT
jgi:pyruvate dehydrogenase E2 component (dihydrolipoamide acetyltransferase)